MPDQKSFPFNVRDRIRLIEREPKSSDRRTGTIVSVVMLTSGKAVVGVDWDEGAGGSVIYPDDRFELIDNS